MSVINRYKWGRRIVIFLPMLFSVAFVANTMIGYYDGNVRILDELCGLSVGSVVMLYMMHMMFGLCARHRIMIDYLLVSTLVSLADAIIGIPLGNLQMLGVYLCIFGVFAIARFLTVIYDRQG